MTPTDAGGRGVELGEDGHRFTLFCTGEVRLTLLLFERAGASAPRRLALDADRHRRGNVWRTTVPDLEEPFEYLWEVERGGTRTHVLDPHARVVTGGERWAADGRYEHTPGAVHRPRRGWVGPAARETFDATASASRPRRPFAEHVVYELHVRGFTRAAESGVAAPGTFAGLREKIPYLVGLGVTAVEWMPCHEFEELANPRRDPESGARLLNYWGYDPLHWFAPKLGYCEADDPAGALREIRETIDAFHDAGIEVWLDVVFNHTAEHGEDGPTLHFKATAPEVYYLRDAAGAMLDVTGCGNTVRAHHPEVRATILESLRWWHRGLGVDGFRFDLAAALTRGDDGEPLEDPPLLREIAEDRELADATLVAEAWDAAGLYRLGEFPRWGRWSEWNGRFRDDVRRFWRGDRGVLSAFATRLTGSADLYGSTDAGAAAGINYLASHDGATLRDALVYPEKRNVRNAEGDRDGDDHEIRVLEPGDPLPGLAEFGEDRRERWKGLWTSLLLARGVPMFFMGDERGRTQWGNNNAWCQDNAIGWMDWTDRDAEGRRVQSAMTEWVRGLIARRRGHPAFRTSQPFPAEPQRYRAVWTDEGGGEPDWNGNGDRTLVLTIESENTPPLRISFDARPGGAAVRVEPEDG